MAFESRNPTTGQLLNTYPEHTPQELQIRLQGAWDGWKKWSRTPLSERTAFLIRLAELLETRADDYARLITLEMGKPVGEALGEVKKAAFGARHFAGEGAAYIQPEAIPGTPGRVVYESLGPVLAIISAAPVYPRSRNDSRRADSADRCASHASQWCLLATNSLINWCRARLSRVSRSRVTPPMVMIRGASTTLFLLVDVVRLVIGVPPCVRSRRSCLPVYS